MPEFLLELFSEEIPARMQERASADLQRLVTEALAPLNPRNAVGFSGPRRIALTLELDAIVPGTSVSERGPREGAPDQALAGFTRKFGVERDALTLEGGFWVLNRTMPPIDAGVRIAEIMPPLLRRFPWPKSMRWGTGSNVTWVRPLRRILCLLDGTPISFSLADGEDNGHHLQAGNVTEGHRFLAPEPFTVSSAAHWREELRRRFVVADAAERRQIIEEGINDAASRERLSVVPDAGLVDEVAGLVEWPSCYLGRIDDAFMELPPEVMQVSMRINQRYFALRNADGSTAAHFAFVANMLPAQDDMLVISGNERVLRARFADARHFWDLDRSTTLESRVSSLDKVVFHASLGSQGNRIARIEALSAIIAPLVGASADKARRAARLAKADLGTGMVGEFPELQGIMGAYYARHDGEDTDVARAVGEHYMPRGANDGVPHAPVSVCVALADKIDSLTAFFAAGEKPGGSGDPYALRRAALGIIRIIRENGLRLDLVRLFTQAAQTLPASLQEAPDLALLPEFIADRLRVQLRAEGARHDILAAISVGNTDSDIVRLLARADALTEMLGTEDGRNLLSATKRAANILRIEDRKDGPHDGASDAHLYVQDEERALATALAVAIPTVEKAIAEERFGDAMLAASGLRPVLDCFFDAVTVNAAQADLRTNRLKLLSQLRRMTVLIADFSQIEG